MTAADVQVRDAEVATRGGEVFVRSWVVSDSTRTPVVLLHDSLGSVDLWRDFPERLAREAGRTVIAYDRIGYGRSTVRDVPPTLGFIEEEAAVAFPELARMLGLERFVLLGHSVGGAMALTIAARDARCRAIVSISAQAFVEQRTLDGISAAKAQFEIPGQLLRLEKWHGPRARWVLDAWTEIWLSPAFRTWSLSCLTDVTCPVLVIHGDSDEYGSLAFPETIAAATTGPAQTLITTTGHLPHREDPDTVLAAVVAFLAGDADAGTVGGSPDRSDHQPRTDR